MQYLWGAMINDTRASNNERDKEEPQEENNYK